MKSHSTFKRLHFCFLVLFTCLFTNANAQVTLTLKLYIQGYFIGGGTMNSLLYDLAMSTNSGDVDYITVKLLDDGYNVMETQQGILRSDGMCDLNFSSAVLGNAYYIDVCHRNSIQTMSASMVTMIPITTYYFSTDATQAFGNNMKEVEPGVWAIYSGDINHDCTINAQDLALLDIDIFNFSNGYLCTDLTGDGAVDALDQSLILSNNSLGVSCIYPSQVPPCPPCILTSSGPAAALSFDGLNDYISLGNTTVIKPQTGLTVEIWVNQNDWSIFNGPKTIVGNTQNGGYSIEFDAGNLLKSWVFRNGAYGVTYYNCSALSSGWHHLALTFDGRYNKLYVDGTVVSVNDAGTIYPIQYSTFQNSTFVGAEAFEANMPEANKYCPGKFDELRIWNYARSCEEIATRKDCELNVGSDVGLLAYYKFNQGIDAGLNSTETTLLDAGVNSLHGQLNNFSLNGPSSNWIAPGGVTSGNTCTGPIISPEINVSGNNVLIANGDINPDLNDHTDFGDLGTNSTRAYTFIIDNSGNGPLTISGITITGPDAGLFTLTALNPSSIIPPLGAASFTISFSPLSTGIKNAAIQISYDDCNEGNYTFDLKGNGIEYCVGNFLLNPGFSNGLNVTGPLPLSTVDNWSGVNGSPDIVVAPGCQDNGYMHMWGNKFTAESIQQTLSAPILQGHTYTITFCARWYKAGTPSTADQFVKFLFRASNASVYNNSSTNISGTLGVIGITESIENVGYWATYQLTDWVADANYTTLSISVTNNSLIDDASTVSWGEIDNICMSLSPCDNTPLVDLGPDKTICTGACENLSAPSVSGALAYEWYQLPNNDLIGTGASISVCPSTATCYSLRVIFANGCESTDEICITVVSCCDPQNPNGRELIPNGNFEQGDTLFSSDYTNSQNLGPTDIYYVTNNPATTHSAFSACGDHTNGTGQMMVVNGSQVLNRTLWQKTVPVKPMTDYVFSFWATNVINFQSVLPQLRLKIDGVTNTISPVYIPNPGACNWTKFVFQWNSSSNSTATLTLTDENLDWFQNDFAIDDISFKECNSICPAQNITPSLSMSTGYDHSNNVAYPTQASDGGWSVVSTAPPITQPTPYSAWTISKHPNWPNPIGASQWISAVDFYNYKTNNAVPNPPNVFEYCFCLCAADSVEIDFNALADDQASFYLAENPSIIFGSVSSWSIPQHINYKVFLQAGPHCIRADLRNIQQVAMGLNIQGNVYSNSLLKWENCEGVKPIVQGPVSSPIPIQIQPTVSNVSCNGGNDGGISVVATNGTPPYTYQWSTGSSSSTLSNLSVGIYTLTISDDAGDYNYLSVLVTEPAALLINIDSLKQIGCNGGNDGYFSFSTTGGTGPISYSVARTGPPSCCTTNDCGYNPDFTCQSCECLSSSAGPYSNLSAAQYIITVTDANGCFASQTITLTEPPPLSYQIDSLLNVSCNGGNDGYLSVTGSGGSGTVEIYVISAASYTAGNLTCCNGGDVCPAGHSCHSIDLGNGRFTCECQKSATTPVAALEAGKYYISVYDAITGCSIIDSINITEPPAIILSSSFTPIQCFGGSTCVNIIASGGTAPYSGTGSFCSIGEGTTNFSVTDDNGCVANTSVTVTEPAKIEATFIVAPANCGLSNGSLISNASGGSAPYEYSLDGVFYQTANNFGSLAADMYIVRIRDANGCLGAATVQVPTSGGIPNYPDPITGPAGACRNQNNIVFSIPPVSGADEYIWILPSGATGSSTGTSISVNFGPNFQGGFICVRAKNACGTSMSTCFNIPVFTVKPGQPGFIIGNQNPCGPNVFFYSIPSVSNAGTYNWSVTGTGVAILSGQGSNSVGVSIPAGFGQGSISVNVSNCVGTTSTRTLTLTGIPANGNALTGPGYVCANTNNVAYGINSVLGTSGYLWSTTGDMSIASSNGPACTVNFGPNFTTGTLGVTTSSPCGSFVKSYTIKSVPGQPGSITGPGNNLCGQYGVTYSIAPVTSATSYNWTVPPGATITNNTGISITVDFTTSFTTSGNVCVTAVSACGSSPARCYLVSAAPSAPASVIGPASVCQSSSAMTYSVSPVAGSIYYTWYATNGATVSPQGIGLTAIVNFTTATASPVSVRAKSNNDCNFSGLSSKSVAVNFSCREDGLMKQAEGESFYVYPNPTSGKVRIDFVQTGKNECIFKIIDLLGNEVETYKASSETGSNTLDIDLSNLTKGMYFITLERSGKGVQKQKIIVQ